MTRGFVACTLDAWQHCLQKPSLDGLGVEVAAVAGEDFWQFPPRYQPDTFIQLRHAVGEKGVLGLPPVEYIPFMNGNI